MVFLKAGLLLLLALAPYLILVFNGFSLTRVDVVNFLMMISFFILPIVSTGFLRLAIALMVSVLYFIMIFTLLSFGDFLSLGAFSSIMETNIEESIGYIQQFGYFPLLESLFFSILTFVMLITFKVKNNLNTIHASSLMFLLILMAPLYANLKNSERFLIELKDDVEGVLVKFYSKSIISPFANYMSYKKEQVFLSKSDVFIFPENIKLGKDSDYNKIYLIIGESASSRHFSYAGYLYPTTPLLDQRAGDDNLYWVENAISPSPITRDSLKRVLSFATASNDSSYYEYINIINAAKIKDFKTYWISSQYPSGAYNTVIGKVGKSADFSVFGQREDEKLLGILNDNFDKNVKQFFVLHLYGSHAAYNNYIDSDYNEFVEMGNNNADYDATIKKTDKLIDTIIKSMPKDSLFIYLSDHGEVVGKGHGLKFPSKEQFEVPFFIYDTSGKIESTIDFLSDISVNGVFNIQMTMELVLKSLGYEFSNLEVPNPLEVYFSNGNIINYSEMEEKYSHHK